MSSCVIQLCCYTFFAALFQLSVYAKMYQKDTLPLILLWYLLDLMSEMTWQLRFVVSSQLSTLQTADRVHQYSTTL